ncbi:MAG: MATE family efflux transporter, partial [Clostridia bacterium]|nr:MATE family efflux transporter [Clostridia bacterium]
MVLAVAVPIVIQNGITNFVNLLDNVMVGQLGTESMSGVAIANQLIFVFNLCIFGGLSGAGIFGAQYYGSGNHDGVRQTFRFKLYIIAILSTVFLTAFLTKDADLLSLYLHQSEGGGDLALTLSEGQIYLRIMLLGLIPFALNNAYVGTLRETGETLLPMKAGITAVLVNLVFNWLLIFGHLGFPELGVAGAAIATVLSRYVELAIVMFWTHTHKEKNKFIVGAYRSLHIDKDIVYRIVRKGWPLLLNEVLWSIGMTTLTQCYSTRGLSAVAAVNITSTLSNLFRIVVMASGNSIAILVGQRLGAGRMDEARDVDNKLIFASCSL